MGTIGFNMIIFIYIYLFTNGHKSKLIYKLNNIKGTLILHLQLTLFIIRFALY